jgi:hypothetical protein
VLLKQNINASNIILGASGDKIPIFTLDEGPIAANFPSAD